MTNMTVNQFVEDLKQSFADVTFPTKKMFIDTANDTFDADYASDQLRDKSWQEIDIKLLIRNRDKLTYLTPEGFHFLLPAYLMTMVTSSKNIDIMTENVLLALFEHYQPDSTVVFCRTKIQCHEVTAFLAAYQMDVVALHGDLEHVEVLGSGDLSTFRWQGQQKFRWRHRSNPGSPSTPSVGRAE